MIFNSMNLIHKLLWICSRLFNIKANISRRSLWKGKMALSNFQIWSNIALFEFWKLDILYFTRLIYKVYAFICTEKNIYFHICRTKCKEKNKLTYFKLNLILYYEIFLLLFQRVYSYFDKDSFDCIDIQWIEYPLP